MSLLGKWSHRLQRRTCRHLPSNRIGAVGNTRQTESVHARKHVSRWHPSTAIGDRRRRRRTEHRPRREGFPACATGPSGGCVSGRCKVAAPHRWLGRRSFVQYIRVYLVVGLGIHRKKLPSRESCREKGDCSGRTPGLERARHGSACSNDSCKLGLPHHLQSADSGHWRRSIHSNVAAGHHRFRAAQGPGRAVDASCWLAGRIGNSYLWTGWWRAAAP